MLSFRYLFGLKPPTAMSFFSFVLSCLLLSHYDCFFLFVSHLNTVLCLALNYSSLNTNTSHAKKQNSILNMCKLGQILHAGI